MDRSEIDRQTKGSRRLVALDKRLAADIEDMISAIAEHQDSLPSDTCAIALARMEHALTAFAAVFEGADYLADGQAIENLRRDVHDYRVLLG